MTDRTALRFQANRTEAPYRSANLLLTLADLYKTLVHGDPRHFAGLLHEFLNAEASPEYGRTQRYILEETDIDRGLAGEPQHWLRHTSYPRMFLAFRTIAQSMSRPEFAIACSTGEAPQGYAVPSGLDTFVVDVGDEDALQSTFAQRHGIFLPALLCPDLAAELAMLLSRCPFFEYKHGEDGRISTEEVVTEGPLSFVLDSLLSSNKALRLAERLSGAKHASFTHFHGRIYKMVAGSSYDSWHHDFRLDSDNRCVAVSINLSPEPYEGGILQLRKAEAQELLWEVANTDLGGTLMFRIHPELEHRLTDVVGRASKVAFAGWFRGRRYWPALDALAS